MEINEIIKKRRMELGLTLKDVAHALGTAESTISRYESNGIQNMGVDKLLDLARVLECTPMYLLGLTDSGDQVNSNDWVVRLKKNQYTDFEISAIREYADYLVSKRTNGDNSNVDEIKKSSSMHFTDVQSAKEYLKGLKMLAAFNGQNNFSDSTILQIANTIFKDKGNN